MKKSITKSAATAAMITLVSLVLPAAAHHGWSEYDVAKELRLTGTIAESGYEHPHGHIRLVTPGKTWHAVLAPPSRMSARGLPPADLKKGATVTVVGYANRAKPDEMRAERIIVGERTIELR